MVFVAFIYSKFQAREKEEKNTYKAANKLVTDKKKTLENMEIIFPPNLLHSHLLPSFRAHVAQYKMTVSVADRNIVRGHDIFSWRRTMNAEYHPVAREWKPVGVHVRGELTYLVYMEANELARCVRNEDGLKSVVRRVREMCGPQAQIFLMVVGLTEYFRRKTGTIHVSGRSFSSFVGYSHLFSAL